MTDDDFELQPPELKSEDFLVVQDDRFHQDTVALVTGAASGIGRTTALALAQNCLTVAGVDIDEEGLKETKELAEDLECDGTVEPIKADLTDEEEIKTAVQNSAELGTLRYVANIAGLQHIDAIEQFPTEKYDLLQDVMVRAPFLVSREALPHIRNTDDGVGAIANMSSVHGHMATERKPAYITAKHALNGLTRSIAAEGDGTLRSFSVSVGYVLTPLMVNQIEDTAKQRGISKQEVVEDVMLGQARTKEMMRPVEVANLFTFGFSRHGKHLNGGDMLWDGGYKNTYM